MDDFQEAIQLIVAVINSKPDIREREKLLEVAMLALVENTNLNIKEKDGIMLNICFSQQIQAWERAKKKVHK